MKRWLELIFPLLLAAFVLADARGTVHGKYDTHNATMQWNASRPTGYGAVPEYRPVALADNGDLAIASAWNGRWADLSGLYWLGARYYDPVSGSFVSCDPLGHDGEPNLYGFCGGDPVNYFDPDGRLGKPAWSSPYSSISDYMLPSPANEWFTRTVLAPLRQSREDLDYNNQFAGVGEARANFWNGVLNVATLGVYNSATIAFTGYDIYNTRVYGVERGIAIGETALLAASFVPWGKVATVGGRAGDFLSSGFSRVGGFLDETAPIFNPANYRYDPAKLYGGLPLPEYVSPSVRDLHNLSVRPSDMGQLQGREFRIDWLEVNEFNPNMPSHVRGWLAQERRLVESGIRNEPRTPPGYVQAHGRTTPAREGFDYSNARLQGQDLNMLEESVRRRKRPQ